MCFASAVHASGSTPYLDSSPDVFTCTSTRNGSTRVSGSVLFNLFANLTLSTVSNMAKCGHALNN